MPSSAFLLPQDLIRAAVLALLVLATTACLHRCWLRRRQQDRALLLLLLGATAVLGMTAFLLAQDYRLRVLPDRMAGMAVPAWDGWLLVDGAMGLLALALLAVSRQRDDQLQRLLSEATTDPLTGVLNRRALMALAGPALERPRRQGEPSSLVMLDLDHFKRINDGHGHAAGDAVLQQLGAVLRSASRGRDIIARVGGEEFVLLLPGEGVDGARSVAERLREDVARLIPHPGGEGHRITLSAGLAAIGPGEPVAALEKALSAADQALYAAKAAGRDRVIVASGPVR
ncbi:GGDEF domain-containing protein [Roseomonas sp. OT10]|uniref:GGDEF domain-containing protein n=1 Tax=Roseomonas cutis TaxID=2897332 RepID=UPI001E50355D|nr:GGDEF domain-containing protein [Roseomonas sp. OT10]UFN50368.1 GGDEF domain-containing protein [Roseomonas sp. OT10]